jgi:NADH-quinone oxidoreductase subunit M
MIFGTLDRPALKGITDMNVREVAVLAPLVFLTILFGVWPAPVLDVTAASVKRLVANYETAIKAKRADLPVDKVGSTETIWGKQSMATTLAGGKQ